MSFLDKISNFYYKNRKNILYILMFLFIFTVFTDLSFADGPNGNGATTVNQQGVTQAGKTESNVFFDALNGIGKIIGAILGMLTFLVGLFLYPAWTNGSFIGLVDPLKTMWIMVSNIVYFIFAFIFIWIAFMNIIGKEDSYQLKQAIPKFIIGVLIVPFSWFFVQFIISLSGILTVGVLSLPYDTFKGTEFFSKISDIEVGCKDTIIDKNDMKCKEGDTKIKLDKLINAENSESLFGIVAFYTYGVMGVENSQKLFEKDVKSFNNLVDLGVKVIIDIIFIIIYLLLMIALFLALFVRGVMLWIFAMFSPVFGLLFFFGKTSEGIGEGTKNFNIKQFIALAFVPVYVAGALAFGLVFIFIAGHGLTIGEKNNVTTILKIEENGNKISFGDLGSVTWSGSNSDSAIRQTGKLIAGFQGTIGTMVLQVFGLGILWMAVMAALKSSEITKAAVEPISSFGNSVGELIKKAPTYAPIIPGPGGQMMSTNALSNAAGSFKSAIESHHSTTGSKIGQGAAKSLGYGDDDLMKMREMAQKSYGVGAETQRGIKDLLGSIKEDRLTEDGYRRAVGDVMKKLGAKDSLINEVVSKGKNEQQLAQILEAGKNNGWDRQADATAVLGTLNVDGIKDLIGGSGGSSGNTDPTRGAIEVKGGEVDSLKREQLVSGDIRVNFNNSNNFVTAMSGNGDSAQRIKLSTSNIDSVIQSSPDKSLLKDLFSKLGVHDESEKRKILAKIFGIGENEQKITDLLNGL